jgi:hypothetical protein
MNWQSIKRVLDRIRPGTPENKERGIALIVALMLLAVMSLLGASALLTTDVETKIAGNTKIGRTAFYAADGIGQASAGIIEDCITDVGWSDDHTYGSGSVAVTVKDGDFAFEARDLDDDADGDVENDRINAPDLEFGEPMAGTADVDKGATVPVAGSSAVASAGYEGAGKGAAGGGLKTVYHIRTRGLFGSRAMSLLFMTYDHYI